MLHKTRGIVLKITDYSENSVVAHVFTEKFGLQAYLINGVKKSRAKIRINILQPLYLLELVVYHKENTGLQRIAEAKQVPIFKTIPYDIYKSTVILFLNEMVYKCLKHQGADDRLFEFTFNAISWLDSIEKMPANFHLFFLLHLSKYLGFFPSKRTANQAYFDLKDGVFSSFDPGHTAILQEPHTTLWSHILLMDVPKLIDLKITNEDRRFLLKKIVDFYQLHIDELGEIKSVAILEEVLG